jgi:PhnB protein
MKRNIQPIPPGYTTVTPWIISKDSASLIEFMQGAFGAEEIPGSRMSDEHGAIMHVEVKIGNAIIMLFDAGKDWDATPAFIRLYVEDGYDVFNKAVGLGAEAITAMTHLFFGDRVGRVRDPFGNLWWIQQRLEDVTQLSPEELGKRASAKESVEAMEYVQRSLQEAMRNRHGMGIVKSF